MSMKLASGFKTAGVAAGIKKNGEKDLGVIVSLHDMWTSCPRFFRLPPAGIQCPESVDPIECGRCANVEFGEVCMAQKPVSVTGTVSEKEGKTWLAATKISPVETEG